VVGCSSRGIKACRGTCPKERVQVSPQRGGKYKICFDGRVGLNLKKGEKITFEVLQFCGQQYLFPKGDEKKKRK